VSTPVSVLDACTLIPHRLSTTLLWLAEAGLFQPLWSEEILDEVQRNLPKLGITPAKAKRRVDAMRAAFGAEALVDGFESLIDEMECDPKDRHVLAAAVHNEADAVVTFNLKDFPVEAADPHGVEILHPDAFLSQLLNQGAEAVITVLLARLQDLRRPPVTLDDWLAGLASVVPMFANLAAYEFHHQSGPVSDIPALVQADQQSAMEAMGELGTFTSPTQVAMSWVFGLDKDLDLAIDLSYDPRGWDYEWAREHLTGRSLTSWLHPAVDAPEQIAFMRFVPEVEHTSQVFQAYLTEMTFLTLVRLEDGTWRVWGLGPGLPPAGEILNG